MTRTAFHALVTQPVRMVAGLWTHRDLVVQFTRRNIAMRHRGSRLGAFWALINPLSMLALYFVIFGLFFQQSFGFPGETRFDFSLAMFLGLTLYHAFSETLGWAPGVITANPNFVKKVVFPLEVLPVAHMGATAFHLLVGVGLILVGGAFSTPGLTPHLLWLPVLVAPLLLIGLGVGWFLSALGVFIRDIGQVTGFLSTALLFATAVTFPPAKIPPELSFLHFNPLFQIIDLARRCVLWGEPMHFGWLAYIYAASVVTLIVGALFFSLLRRSFAEVL